MIIKKFVVGDMGNNNYLLIDNGEAVLIDCTALIPELDSVLKEYNAELKYILLTYIHVLTTISAVGCFQSTIVSWTSLAWTVVIS